MDDLVKRLRAEDPETGLRHSIASEAADRLECLERDLAYERYSRESAATKAWEFAQRIKVLEEALRKIEKNEHGFGTLWSKLVAGAALEDANGKP